MKLYWAPRTRSARGLWILEEAGIDYDLELVTLGDTGRETPEEFREASPMGKVPALVDGDVRMSESSAICLYIADRYSPGNLAPAIDDPLRGKFLYWLMYTPAVVEPAMSEKFSGVETNRFRSGWGDFDLMIETLENGIEGKTWILGEKFTAADVMLGSSVVFLRLFKMLPDSPSLNAYADRCLARPAYQKVQALNEAAGES
ncbi:MAG: glutathione S-transferase family protein [Woeseiaceae bacterium]